jgi:hypothetical protein
MTAVLAAGSRVDVLVHTGPDLALHVMRGTADPDVSDWLARVEFDNGQVSHVRRSSVRVLAADAEPMPDPRELDAAERVLAGLVPPPPCQSVSHAGRRRVR